MTSLIHQVSLRDLWYRHSMHFQFFSSLFHKIHINADEGNEGNLQFCLWLDPANVTNLTNMNGFWVLVRRLAATSWTVVMRVMRSTRWGICRYQFRSSSRKAPHIVWRLQKTAKWQRRPRSMFNIASLAFTNAYTMLYTMYCAPLTNCCTGLCQFIQTRISRWRTSDTDLKNLVRLLHCSYYKFLDKLLA
jgi:hypothetical protein